MGSDNHLEADLRSYRDFLKKCDGIDVPLDDINFEDFLGFLDIEHVLKLRGKDTWSDQGNEGQLLVKRFLGQILWERTPEPSDIPPVYLAFARGLDTTDWVLTFNYDTLLERALEAVGKPYRLYPHRFSEVYPSHAVIDGSIQEVVVLKMHGSIDWFDRSSYVDRLEQGQLVSPGFQPRDPVFGSNRVVCPIPLVQVRFLRTPTRPVTTFGPRSMAIFHGRIRQRPTCTAC